MKKYIALLSACMVLTACQSTNQDVGTVAGGVVGGLIGSQFGGGAGKVAAAAGGAVVGAFIGNQIGKTMDRLDRLEMQRALETAPTGQSVGWQNPDTGNRYTVVPTRTYYNDQQACREYTTRAIIGGKTQEVHGHACRQNDGAWKIVD